MHLTIGVFDIAFSLVEFVSKLNWCKYKCVKSFFIHFSHFAAEIPERMILSNFCRTIVTLFGFSWKGINRHVKHAKNCVTHLSTLVTVGHSRSRYSGSRFCWIDMFVQQRKQYLCHNIAKRKCVHKNLAMLFLRKWGEHLMFANVVN